MFFTDFDDAGEGDGGWVGGWSNYDVLLNTPLAAVCGLKLNGLLPNYVQNQVKYTELIHEQPLRALYYKKII